MSLECKRIFIEGWMAEKLNLKGNELITFALIHGFSQDKDHKHHVSAQNIADWAGTSKRVVFNILKSLLDKGLIKKEEHYEYGIRLVDYYTVDLKELNK